jgi:hypothetical protein
MAACAALRGLSPLRLRLRSGRLATSAAQCQLTGNGPLCFFAFERRKQCQPCCQKAAHRLCKIDRYHPMNQRRDRGNSLPCSSEAADQTNGHAFPAKRTATACMKRVQKRVFLANPVAFHSHPHVFANFFPTNMALATGVTP